MNVCLSALCEQNYISQKTLQLYEGRFLILLNSASKAKACLLSVASSESGAWLPIPSLGTKPDNESLRTALGLRLPFPIAVEHSYLCLWW